MASILCDQTDQERNAVLLDILVGDSIFTWWDTNIIVTGVSLLTVAVIITAPATHTFGCPRDGIFGAFVV